MIEAAAATNAYQKIQEEKVLALAFTQKMISRGQVQIIKLKVVASDNETTETSTSSVDENEEKPSSPLIPGIVIISRL